MDAALTNPAYMVFAAVAPLIISLVKQSGLPTQFNAIIAFIGYIVVGIAGALMAGEELSGENLISFITVATVVGTAAYNLLWSNLGRQTPADPGLDARLNDATSFIKPSSDGGPTPDGSRPRAGMHPAPRTTTACRWPARSAGIVG